MVTRIDNDVKTSALTFEEFTAIIGEPGKNGNYHCPGPLHKNADRNPSLSVGWNGERILIYCHTGCDTNSILAHYGLKFAGAHIVAIDHNGDITDVFKLTPEAKERIEQQKRILAEKEKLTQGAAIAHLQQNRPDLKYHEMLYVNRGYIESNWGLFPATMDAYMIGYCDACPTSPYSASICIPYYWRGGAD